MDVAVYYPDINTANKIFRNMHIVVTEKYYRRMNTILSDKTDPLLYQDSDLPDQQDEPSLK